MRALGASRTSLVPGGVLAGPWVRDGLWRRARAVPSLDLRFADNKSLTDAVTGASLVTFTRASSGTFVGSDGVIQTAATDVPRFDHNPVTGESLGLLVEEQRTQILELTDALATQTKTVTATAHTLSFYGSGTVVLSGVHSATVAGTGAYPARTTLTFTPTAGSLTLTVTGTVQFGQLEAGAFATSYIPNAGVAAVTRSADVASITGSAFSGWYRQDEGTVFAEGRRDGTADGRFFGIDTGSILNTYVLTASAARNANVTSVSGGAFGGGATTSNSFSYQAPIRVAASLSNSQDENICLNGGAVATGNATAPVGPLTTMNIGTQSGASTSFFNGPIKRICFWPTRLPNNVLQGITQ